MSDLILQIDNKQVKGWKTANIRNSIYGIASSFSLSIIASDDEDVSILQGSECTIIYKNKIMLTGYIEKLNISEKEDGDEITVTGRSKLCDLVDSSIPNQKQFKDLTVDQIIKKIASQFGIKVTFKHLLNPKLKQFTIEPGETAFSVIERLAKASASLILGTADGSLMVVDNSFYINPNVLASGSNLIDLDITQDLSRVFHKYKAVSQKVSLAGDSNETYSAIDNSIRPTRVTELIPSNGESIENLVEYTAKVRKAKSLSVDCNVIGWDYSVADKVKFISNYLTDTLIITDTDYNLSIDKGFTSKLSLSREESLLVKKEDINSKKGGIL